MSIAPPDVVAEILSRLTVIDIIRFKCVCKSWYDIIKQPYFIKLHRRRSIPTDGDRVLIKLQLTPLLSLRYSNLHTYHVGPFNKYEPMLEVNLPFHAYKHRLICGDSGVVCFGVKGSSSEFVAWNPLIDKGKRFWFDPVRLVDPELRFIHRTDIGFGYDEASEDYKAVRVVDFSSSEKSWYTKASASEVSVVSVKNNSCRRAQDWPLDQWSSDSFRVSVSFNGALHYCTSWWWQSAISAGAMGEPSIVIFDLTKEAFTVQKIPSFVFQNKNKYYSTGLSVLGGHLSLYVNSPGTHDVWIMKERGGAYDTWTKLYSFEKPIVGMSSRLYKLYKPLLLSKVDNGDDRVLLLAEHFGVRKGEVAQFLYWYDLGTKTCEKYYESTKEEADKDHWSLCLGSLHLGDSGVALERLIPVERT